MERKTIGQVAFEAYNQSKGGVTWDGKPIPPWSDVGDAVRAGWEASARAVVEDVLDARREKATDEPLQLEVGVVFVETHAMGPGFRATVLAPADLHCSTWTLESDLGPASTPGAALCQLAESIDREVAEAGWKASALFNRRAPVLDEREED